MGSGYVIDMKELLHHAHYCLKGMKILSTTRKKISTPIQQKNGFATQCHIAPTETACANFLQRMTEIEEKESHSSRQYILYSINLFEEVSFWLPSSLLSQDI